MLTNPGKTGFTFHSELLLDNRVEEMLEVRSWSDTFWTSAWGSFLSHLHLLRLPHGWPWVATAGANNTAAALASTLTRRHGDRQSAFEHSTFMTISCRGAITHYVCVTQLITDWPHSLFPTPAGCFLSDPANLRRSCSVWSSGGDQRELDGVTEQLAGDPREQWRYTSEFLFKEYEKFIVGWKKNASKIQ